MKPALFLLLFLSALSCQTDSRQQQLPAIVAPESTVRNWKAMTTAMLQDWNRFHTPGKTDSLVSLYADSVFFYGQFDLPRPICLEKTKELINKWPDYRQQVDSVDWQLYPPFDSGRVICSFLKTVNIGGRQKQYSAYLNFHWNQQRGKYEIDNEGDSETDQNLDIQAVAAEQTYEQGNYNGDSTREKMWLRLEKVTPQLNSWSTIRFSDPKIPVLPVLQCIGGVPRNEGDLDGDGADEISLIPWWYQSRFTSFRVYTLKNNRWYHLIPGVYCTRDEAESFYQKMVETGDSSFVWIREWEMDDQTTEEKYVRKKRNIRLEPVVKKQTGVGWVN